MCVCGGGEGEWVTDCATTTTAGAAQSTKKRRAADKEQLELHLGWGCQLAIGTEGKWKWKWENFSGLAEHGNESCSQAAVQGDGEFLREIDLKNATFLYLKKALSNLGPSCFWLKQDNAHLSLLIPLPRLLFLTCFERPFELCLSLQWPKRVIIDKAVWTI